MQPINIVATFQSLTQQLAEAKTKALEAYHQMEAVETQLRAMFGATPAPALEVATETEEAEEETAEESVGAKLLAAKKKHGDDWAAIAVDTYGMDTGKNRAKARAYLANLSKKQPKLRAA